MRPLFAFSLGVCLFALGAATGLLAQSRPDSPQRVELQRAPLSGASHMEVIVSTAEYQPGEMLGRHSHHGLEAAYVIQGASIQASGKPPVALATGSSALFLRDVKHAGFTVTGDQSLKLFMVHVVDQGAPLYDYGE